MRRYRHAVLGGTFDHLHVGHAALLRTAFRVGRTVSIGLTTDRFLAAHPKPSAGRVQAYGVRRRALLAFLRRELSPSRYRVVPLENPFGRSVDDGVDVLVVSAETLAGGRAVNRERRRLGRAAVPLVVVPVVLADDLGPVSSRRIRDGTIDRNGRRRAPIVVGLAAADPAARAAMARGVRRVLPRARCVVVPVTRGPSAVSATDALVLARRAVRATELGLGAVQGPGGRWTVAVVTHAIQLPPRKSPAAGSTALAATTAGLLKPALERKLFLPRDASRR